MHAPRAAQKGMCYNAVGYVLSAYCAYKIVMSTVNVLLSRTGKMDPVSRGVQISVDYLGLDFDVKTWSQYISFMMVGIIIVASVRTLLIRVTQVCCSPRPKRDRRGAGTATTAARTVAGWPKFSAFRTPLLSRRSLSDLSFTARTQAFRFFATGSSSSVMVLFLAELMVCAAPQHCVSCVARASPDTGTRC